MSLEDLCVISCVSLSDALPRSHVRVWGGQSLYLHNVANITLLNEQIIRRHSVALDLIFEVCEEPTGVYLLKE